MACGEALQVLRKAGRDTWDQGMIGSRDENDREWERPAPRWFVGTARLCVVWTALGVVDHTLSVAGYGPWLALMPPALVGVLALVPFWVRAAWALGVWASLVGAVLLVARVRHAAVAYALSFAGAVASLTWVYAHGVGPGFLAIALVVMGGIMAQLWLSRMMFWRGVLR